jgi:hypothetical protein
MQPDDDSEIAEICSWIFVFNIDISSVRRMYGWLIVLMFTAQRDKPGKKILEALVNKHLHMYDIYSVLRK